MRGPSRRGLAVDAARSQAAGPVQVSSKSCQTHPVPVGDEVAGARVAVQGPVAVVVELCGQPGVRRGHRGGLAPREPGLRPGQERGDVAQRREHRE